MTEIIRVRGIKRVRAKGRWYLYHRKTGERISAEPGTAAFLAEVEALNGRVAPPARDGSLGALAKAYKISPEFCNLAPRTRSDYERIFEYLRKISHTPVIEIDSPFVLGLRDRAFRKHRRRFANYTVSVLRLLFAWAKPRGLVEQNPAVDVPMIRRGHDEPVRNRAWATAELAAVIAAAPAHLRLPIVISAYTGMREGDVIRLPWSAWDGATITWCQRKTNKVVWVPAHQDLRAVIQAAPKRTTQIVCTRKGKAFTESGFRASFFKLLRKLASERKIGTGLTFHGLRTTIATQLADRGNESRTIMAITGHTTESQVATYTEGADRRRRAVAAIASLERNRDGNGKP